MAPALFDMEETASLQSDAQRIKEFQTSRNLPFSQLAKRYPGIGTDRTFNKVLKGETSDLDVDRWARQYRAVVMLMTSRGETETVEDLYDDLWPAAELLRVFSETKDETGNGRWVALLGPSGSGKTCARNILTDTYPGRFAVVEASDAWKESPMAYLEALLTALGEKVMPYSCYARLEKAVELLNTARLDVITEEAHHLGPANLNIQVTLINRTPSIFVDLAIDTLWNKLRGKAYEECRQLSGNRLAEVIRIGNARDRDVQKILSRRLTWHGETLKSATAFLIKYAPQNGQLALVRDVCKRLRERNKPVTQDVFEKAVAEEVASR